MVAGVAGIGSLPFGTGSVGTGADASLVLEDHASIAEGLAVSAPFRVTNATSLSAALVKVDFSGLIDPDHASNFSTANYTIAGLTVLNVDPFGPESVILQTSDQSHISYTVVVNSTAGQIQSPAGDPLNPLHASATFQGNSTLATFVAVAQSRRKLRLTFSQAMLVDAAFIDPANYSVTRFDGSSILIDRIEQVGLDTTRAQVVLGEDLVPFEFYTLQVGASVRTVTNDNVFPDQQLLQLKEVIPRPIRLAGSGFSGEVRGGLLGSPDGQVFFSPAFGASVPNSVIQVESVSVCTRAYDVYAIPSLPDPVLLYTYPPPGGTSSTLGAAGGVLRASAYRLGLALMEVSDRRTETFAAAVDGPAEGLLEEPIDITRASFLNDARWRIFPGTGASLGAFRTADNLTPIGPGPTIGPFAIP